MTNLVFLLQVNVQNAVADTLAKASPKESSMTLFDLVLKGGWIMLPIGLLLVVAVYIFFERYFYIRMAARTDTDFMNKIRERYVLKKINHLLG